MAFYAVLFVHEKAEGGEVAGGSRVRSGKRASPNLPNAIPLAPTENET